MLLFGDSVKAHLETEAKMGQRLLGSELSWHRSGHASVYRNPNLISLVVCGVYRGVECFGVCSG